MRTKVSGTVLLPIQEKVWLATLIRSGERTVGDCPDVGRLELGYRSMDLPVSDRAVYDLTVYTAEPGTSSEARLRLLASWAATQPSAAEPT
ncbi:hypothetical protein [Streptomyces sp. NPDC087859]|uniref:MmyB family transcriptional regulator n=1 Tax=Streptomyces sp. NPDC087859 TaxID=3365812 RepID=UPI003822FF78